ncbi:SAV_6107 family HEPN domain-containing protein [Corynebacterium senegalense]|uniref:SAV_6107 family HEPN domain-containing protein n=1 Tax=Corynebacterium senegalense TaxID=2080750 RepID=UPI000E1FF1FB|nr:SAV_6107 family HEPN domain-containing protein [Corynebacterium senegalense]
MNSIISATTGAAYGAVAGASKSSKFFAAADGLLGRASALAASGDYALALEYGYRAALRIAGAVCADSPVIRRRKRLPSSAWDKLALTGESGAAWAGELSRYSALRGRVASGIETAPDPETVRSFLRRVEEFYIASQPGATLVA